MSSQRRGRLLSNNPPVYAKRVYETLADNPTAPLPRIEALLDAATRQCRPLSLDPDTDAFVAEAHRYIGILMQESHRVAIHAQRRIGRVLDEALSNHPAASASYLQLAHAVCNRASVERGAYFRRILDECSQAGCDRCTAAKQSADTPCQTTQSICRLKDYEFENFTQTYLSQCRTVAALQAVSTLLRGSDPHTQFRELVDASVVMKNRVPAAGLPTIASGLVPVFEMAEGESPVEAIQYLDGDGGSIVSQKFPGLCDHLRQNNAIPMPNVNLQRHGYLLLPFREQHHDAIELGHVFSIAADVHGRGTQRTGEKEFGYEALIAARRNLSRAKRLWIVPSSSLQGYVSVHSCTQ